MRKIVAKATILAQTKFTRKKSSDSDNFSRLVHVDFHCRAKLQRDSIFAWRIHVRGKELCSPILAANERGQDGAPQVLFTLDLEMPYFFAGVMLVTGKSQCAKRISNRRCSSRL